MSGVWIKALDRAGKLMNQEGRESSWSWKAWVLIGIVAPLIVAFVWGGLRYLINECLNDPDPTPEFNEAAFRIGQVDELTQKVVASITSASANNNREMQEAFGMVPLLKVAAELGGVTSMPLGEDATVWIGGSGCGVTHLPRKRGFRYSEFVDVDLKELWRRYYKARCGGSPPAETTSGLGTVIAEYRKAATDDAAISDLPRVGSNLYEYGQWREQTSVESVEIRKAAIEAWVRRVSELWEAVKSHYALEPFQMPPPEQAKC